MEVVTTITPIFIVIFMGWVARKKGWITREFQDPANRLLYYFSIPALIFSAVAHVSFSERFDGRLLSLTLVSAGAIYVIALLISKIVHMEPHRAGVFIQSSGHGNIGYIGLPIAYYYLGRDDFATVGIICGFLMILQNFLSIIVLQFQVSENNEMRGVIPVLKGLAGNPVIIGALAGMLVSATGLTVPAIPARIIDILGGMAPPMALLLIGVSLSLTLMRKNFRPVMGSVLLKLIVLPAVGVILFSLGGVAVGDYLPSLILLCSPTATIIYVMAGGVRGDTDFAVAAISASTLLSSITLMLWLILTPLLLG